MHYLSIICFAGSALLTRRAVVAQCRDYIPNNGNTSSGEITTLLLLHLAALLAAVGSLAYLHWYFSLIIFLAGSALSFLTRHWVSRWLRCLDDNH